MKDGFFKENGRYIGKLLRTHIVMSIFGIMVFIPFNNGSIALKAFIIAGSVVAVLLFLFLIDVDMWYLGAEDKIRVDAGRQKRQPLKGLWLGFISQIPSFVIGLILVITEYFYMYFQAYEFGTTCKSINVVTKFINLLWSGMYQGISNTIFDKWTLQYSWFYLFIPLLPSLFAALTYWLGLNNSPILKPPSREKKQD